MLRVWQDLRGCDKNKCDFSTRNPRGIYLVFWHKSRVLSVVINLHWWVVLVLIASAKRFTSQRNFDVPHLFFRVQQTNSHGDVNVPKGVDFCPTHHFGLSFKNKFDMNMLVWSRIYTDEHTRWLELRGGWQMRRLKSNTCVRQQSIFKVSDWVSVIVGGESHCTRWRTSVVDLYGWRPLLCDKRRPWKRIIQKWT